MHLPLTTALPLIVSLLTLQVQARDVPANIQTLYNNIKRSGSCTKVLKSGFYAKDDPPNTFSYCGDHIGEGVVYLQGTGGALADMDIDCDGLQNSPASDGRCGSSTDTQSHTSFEDTVKSYNKGVDGLDAYIHPYVVFGNVGSNPGFVNYDPRANGVHELGLIAVVCGNGKMFYGIWGDENGDDGPRAVIGEASISMATLCFGNVVNGNNGHDETDVLYLAFTGADAVPGKDGAKWNAKNAVEFEESLKGLGDKLVARIGGGSTTTTTLKTTTTKPTTSTKTTTKTTTPTCTSCSWTGHCAGATCSTADDCDGDLVCTGGRCGGCTWAGHCLCATCSTGDDCADDLVCKSGKCAKP